MNTFVVGSNVDGKNRYLNIIKEYRVALVYYNPSGTIERDFNKIQPGDLIIIASGTNFNKKCFYAGYAQSSNRGYFDINNEKIDGHIYLDNFVCLTNYNIPFSTENSQKASTYTQPVYQLYESTPADKVIIEQIKNIIRLNGSKSTSEYNELLKNNYNLILTGAPGTGKTYLAKQIAAKMIFGEEKNINEMNDDEKAKFKEQYKFVQFHPSYDYTDFVEGIRPVTKENNNYGFERKDGTFKEFCKKAIIVKENDIKTFCEHIKKEINDTTIAEFPIKGIGGDYVAPICKIDINDNDVRVEVKTPCNHYFKKTYSELLKLYSNYKNYINSFNQKYKEFVNTYNMPDGTHTYMHGFLHAMYEYFNNKPFVFVIDEINRGDINKILGELFYSLDLGYRGEKGKVDTQYQNLVNTNDVFADGFYIPENVYIIGTMNDIDRSVESMDFAIRRRFAWHEVKPEDTADEILKNIEIDNVVFVLNEFNKFIANHETLGEMYKIGASYFLKLDKYFKEASKNNEDKAICTQKAYEKLWDNHLKGLIHEYIRGKKYGNVTFEAIEKEYKKLTGLNIEINNEDAEQ